MSILGKIANNKRWELIQGEITLPTYSITSQHGMTYQNKIKILDLGCGDGWFVKKLSELEGIEAMGVDINLKEETKNLLKISAYRLPFFSNSFDYVLTIEIIEHLHPKVYKEIKRVLKPGGKLIVTSPKPKWNWLIELLSSVGLADDLVTPHLNCVYPEDLPFKLIKKQSFMLIEWFGVFENGDKR